MRRSDSSPTPGSSRPERAGEPVSERPPGSLLNRLRARTPVRAAVDPLPDRSTSAAESGVFPGGIFSSPSRLIALISRLSADLPGTIAGPRVPPFRSDSGPAHRDRTYAPAHGTAAQFAARIVRADSSSGGAGRQHRVRQKPAVNQGQPGWLKPHQSFPDRSIIRKFCSQLRLRRLATHPTFPRQKHTRHRNQPACALARTVPSLWKRPNTPALFRYTKHALAWS